MISSQGCIHTCTLPGEVYQVQQLRVLLQMLEVAISLILSNKEATGSSVPFSVSEDVLLKNWLTSICHFCVVFNLSNAQCFQCFLVQVSLTLSLQKGWGFLKCKNAIKSKYDMKLN